MIKFILLYVVFTITAFAQFTDLPQANLQGLTSDDLTEGSTNLYLTPAVTSSINQNTADISTNTSSINGLDADHATYTSSINQNRTDIDSNDVELSTITSSVQGIETEQTTQTSSINANKAAIDSITVGETSTSFGDGLGFVLSSSADFTKSIIYDLGSITTTRSYTMPDSDGTMALLSDLNTLTSSAQSHDAELATYTSSIDQNAADISTNTSSIDLIETEQTTQTSSINQNSNDISVATSSTNQNSDNISTNTSSIDLNVTNISTNTSSVNLIETEQSTQTSSINQNASDIAGLSGGAGADSFVEAATSTTLADGFKYYATKTATPKLVFTLPQSSTVGNTIEIVGAGAGGWKLHSNATSTVQEVNWGSWHSSRAAASSTTLIAETNEYYGSIKLVATATNKYTAYNPDTTDIYAGIDTPAGVGSYWRFNEKLSTTSSYLDNRGNFNLSKFGSTVSFGKYGQFNENIQNFTTNTSYVRGYYAPYLNSATTNSKLTVEVWVKFANLAGDGGVQALFHNTISDWTSASDAVQLAQINGTTFRFGNNAGNLASYNNSALDGDGIWHYVVGVLDCSDNPETKLYVDSALVGSDTTACQDWGNADGYITIGGNAHASQDWHGRIDDVAYWPSTAMTAEQIAERYRKGKRVDGQFYGRGVEYAE